MLSAVACALAGFAIASILRPVYRAEVLVAHAADSSAGSGGLGNLASQFGGLASLVGVSLNSGSSAEPLGILRSRALADRFMRELGITDAVANKGQTSSTVTSVEELAGRAYDRFDRNIRRILEGPESGLVTIRFEWYDRKQVSDWANQYVGLANRVVQERAISQSDMRLEYLDGAVEEAGSIELRQALFNLIESEIKSKMLASIDNEIAFRVVDPAVTPLEDEFARPNRALLTGLSFLAGLLLAISVSYVMGVIRSRAAAPQHAR